MNTMIAENNTGAAVRLADTQPVHNIVGFDRQIQLKIENGKVMTFQCMDLSAEGLNLKCTYEEIIAINPEGLHIDMAKPRLARATFSVPLDVRQIGVDVITQVDYVALLPDSNEAGKFIVGLRFKKFFGNTRNYLIHYLASALK